ncbi:MAG: hypothetical protein ACE5JO_08930 [Candidatus Binatia bacterium]
MDRLQELMERFPRTPRSIVLKADVLREGLRDTPDLRRIGQWALSSASIVFNTPEEGDGDGTPAGDGPRLPDRLNLFCWYCYSMSICRDYPRLAKPVEKAAGMDS